MRVRHLGEAISVLQQVRQTMLDKHLFRGFSGPARVVSGSVALLVAALMASPYYPSSVFWHLIGWACVFLVASVLNLGAIFYWFWQDATVQRNPRRLMPVVDVLPPLAVGAIMTFALIYNRQVDPLFGVWMCMFGLTNFATRYMLPLPIALVGLFYVLAGGLCLVLPQVAFLNPWPMGVVFFCGEWCSGLLLYRDRRRYTAICKTLEEWDDE